MHAAAVGKSKNIMEKMSLTSGCMRKFNTAGRDGLNNRRSLSYADLPHAAVNFEMAHS
jgi:hypothetical protein